MVNVGVQPLQPSCAAFSRALTGNSIRHGAPRAGIGHAGAVGGDLIATNQPFTTFILKEFYFPTQTLAFLFKILLCFFLLFYKDRGKIPSQFHCDISENLF